MNMDIMVNQKLATFLDQHPKIENGKHKPLCVGVAIKEECENNNFLFKWKNIGHGCYGINRYGFFYENRNADLNNTNPYEDF